MHLNNKNQQYEIISLFNVTENGETVTYARVKFNRTKHEQIVKAKLLKNGDFEDESLKNKTVAVEDMNVETRDSEIGDEKNLINDDKNITNDSDLTSKSSKIIATKPNGEEVVVDDLEQFCKDNKLDIEMVNNVLAGIQKTHRKFKFREEF